MLVFSHHDVPHSPTDPELASKKVTNPLSSVLLNELDSYTRIEIVLST